MTELAKDVAKELEARARRRKLVMLVVWAGLVVAAVLYLRCGQGWGTGGSGTAGGPGTAAHNGSAKQRCQLRVGSAGIQLDGKPISREGAVEQCARGGGGAEVTITGDAREGDWVALRGMLSSAHVDIIVHQPPAVEHAAGSGSGSAVK